MIIVLIREKLKTETRDKKFVRMGKLYIDGIEYCDTLESETLKIPNGCYAWSVSQSPKFKRELPLIYNFVNVKAERGIRVHAGNTIDDTRGCILVGRRVPQDAKLSDSRLAESQLVLMTRGTCHTFIVTENYEL